MKKANKKKVAKPEALAGMADEGKRVAKFFAGTSRMVQPIQRGNVDLTATVLQELD